MVKHLMVASLLVGALLGGARGTALAAAGANASCTGVQNSNVTAYFGPGGVAELNHSFQQYAEEQGVPFGSLVSSVSQQHLGYAGCFQ